MRRERGSRFKRCGHSKAAWGRCQHPWTLVVSWRDPETRRLRQEWRTFRGSGTDAERKLTGLLADRDKGKLTTGGKALLESYLSEEWLPYQRTRVRPQTFERYQELLRSKVIPRIGGVRLDKITPRHVQAVIDGMIDGGFAPRTIVQCYRVLSEALDRAVKWGMISTNPAKSTEPPKVERPKLTIPDTSAVARIMRGAEGTELEVPVALAATTGMRRGEVLALRWSDVDLNRGLVTVSGSLQRGDGNELERRDPKSEAERRVLALPGPTVEVLKRHRKGQGERRLLLGEGWKGTGLVVDRGDGAPMNPDLLTKRFHRLVDGLGLEGVRFHDLRHAYATTLLRAGLHPKIAADSLGQFSATFTMDTYQHGSTDLQRTAAAAIEAAFSQAEQD